VTAAVRAEWTKLRTVAGPAWLLVSLVALTIWLSAASAASVTCTAPECGVDQTKLSLTGVQLGQAIVAVLAVLVVGNEYSTGMIRTTLAAVPRRTVALAAKAAVLVGPVLVAGVIAVAGSLVAGRHWLPLSLSLAHGSTLRAAGGSVLYLVLIALLGLGIGATVRDPAAAIGTVLGLLYLFPILASVVNNPHWQRHLKQIGPSSAGLAIQATVGVRDLPIGPWAGLGVLGLWAAGALLLGGLLFQVRDA
jgi:ABC-2 type transport system permease protein